MPVLHSPQMNRLSGIGLGQFLSSTSSFGLLWRRLLGLLYSLLNLLSLANFVSLLNLLSLINFLAWTAMAVAPVFLSGSLDCYGSGFLDCYVGCCLDCFALSLQIDFSPQPVTPYCPRLYACVCARVRAIDHHLSVLHRTSS